MSPELAPTSPLRRVLNARWPRYAAFAAWLAFAIYAIAQHAMWRDEVRALSLALQGDGIAGLFARIHGEGHPALWYLLLRGAHELVGRPEVMPALSLAIAASAMLLLVWRAPLAWPWVVLILATHFGLFEYVVKSRNYGISMLLMFAFAALYRSQRRRGIVLGLVLFLLANTNLPSVILAGSFLLLWLVDLVSESGMRWSAQARWFVANSLIAAAGVAVCALTVLPPFNDATVPDWSASVPLRSVVSAVLNPATSFSAITTTLAKTAISDLRSGVATIVLSVLMFASLLALVRRPGALAAGLASLVGLSLFLMLTGGAYRHHALWLVFVIALLWIAKGERAAEQRGAARPLVAIGMAAFAALLLLQFVRSVEDVRMVASGTPFSRSREFAAVIRTHPELRDAVIMGDPDYLIEPLPYYLDNPTYLVREQRFGPVVRFTKAAILDLSLGDLLAAGQRLRGRTGRPVVILLEADLSRLAGGAELREAYNWRFRIRPDEVRAFRAGTTPLVRFARLKTGESFDAYVVR